MVHSVHQVAQAFAQQIALALFEPFMGAEPGGEVPLRRAHVQTRGPAPGPALRARYPRSRRKEGSLSWPINGAGIMQCRGLGGIFVARGVSGPRNDPF